MVKKKFKLRTVSLPSEECGIDRDWRVVTICNNPPVLPYIEYRMVSSKVGESVYYSLVGDSSLTLRGKLNTVFRGEIVLYVF